MIRRVRTVVLGALLAASAAYVATRSVPEAPRAIDLSVVARRELVEGVDLLELALTRADTQAGRAVVLFIEPGALVPEIVINTDAKPIAQIAPEALIVVNAGFFTAEWRPTGLLAAGGRVLSPFVPEGGPAGSGVFVLEGEDSAPELVARDKVGARSFAAARLAIQAGPRIIEADGAPGIRSDNGARANRTVLGADGRGRVVLAVVEGPAGSLSGPTLFETQLILGVDGLGRIEKSLALRFALNLDGGPSTGLAVRAPGAPAQIVESSTVHSLLAFRRRP